MVDYTYQDREGKVTKSNRFLKTNVSSTVIRDARQLSILEKVNANQKRKFSDIVSYRNHFGFNSDFLINSVIKKIKNIKQIHL